MKADLNPNDTLAKKTVKGIMWSSISFAVSKGITFLSTIILARLLVPDDFGIMALGLLAVNYLDKFGELGVGNVIIYRQDDLERNSNVAFTLGMIVNLILAFLGFISAPYISIFFNNSRLVDILRVLSITLVLSGLGSIHRARLDKDLKFKQSFVPELAKTLAKATVSLVLAFLGFGVWSLVWGQVAADLAATSFYWFITGWRPRLMLDLKIIRGLLGYSSFILLVEILGVIQNNLDYLIIGRRFDAASLGYYSLAFRVPELAIVYVCSLVSKALFPAFSKIQDNLSVLREGYLSSLSYIAIYTLPVATGLAFIAPQFVRVVYGDKWLLAIPLMQILSLYTLVYSLGFNSGDVYKATGRPEILTYISIFEILLIAPLLWVAAEYGIFYVALVHLVANILILIVRFVVVRQLLKISFLDLFQALRPAFTVTFLMSITIVFTQVVLEKFSNAFILVGVVLIGATSFIFFLWLIDRPFLYSAVDMVRGIISSRTSKEEL